MAVLRWQWTLPNRGRVEAVLDQDAATEVVSQGGRELSRSARGALPDGHVVTVTGDGDAGVAVSERPPIEVVVTFASTAPICVLRHDGEEIAPVLWPSRERPAPPPTPPTPWLRYGGIGLGVTLLLMAGISIRASRRDPPPPSTALEHAHRAPSGLFVAHYPGDVEPRPTTLPPGVSGLLLEDQGHTLSLLVAATILDPTASHDPWTIQQRLHDEAVSNVTRNAAKYEDGRRRDETCLGRPGAVVTGELMLRDTRLAKVWSCAVVKDDTAYLLLTTLTEPTTRADERRLRTIVDAIELTRLADIGAAGPTPSVP